METAGETHVTSKRIHVRDRKSVVSFLIDAGSDLSLLTATAKDRRSPNSMSLFAANETRIATFGNRRLEPDLGFQSPIPWNFVIADIARPIIGADFSNHHNFVVISMVRN